MSAQPATAERLPRWIRFDLAREQPPKTQRWEVVTADAARVLLGHVQWYGAWRRYAFMPAVGRPLVFEERCLRDIADFCAEETRKRRAA